MAITLPVVVILYDIIVKRLSVNELMKKLNVYAVLIVISVVYVLIRWLILRDVPERETYFYFYGKDLLTSFLTMLPVLPLYFKLLVVPTGLLYHYSGYMPYISSFGDLHVLFSLFFILLLLALAFYLIKRIPLVSYSIFFFFITLMPVLNIVPTMNFMAERFLYIPSVIVSISLTVLFIKYYSEKTGKVFYGFFTAVIFLFGVLTVIRNSDWRDNNTLFLSAEGRPGTVIYVNIGNIYANNNELDKAEVYYRKAIDLRSKTLLANDNLGKIFLLKGNYDSAYYYIHKAYLLDTLSPEPMFTMAQLDSRFDKVPEAIEEMEKIQRVTPNYMNSAKMLAELKLKMAQKTDAGKPPASENSAEIVNRIAQLEQQSYNSYREKKYIDAISALNQLIKLNPLLSYSYYNNMGMCYIDMNRLDDARKYFELAVQSKQDFSTGYNNLGSVYEKMGDRLKAKENYRKAVDADSDNQDAKNNLDRVK
jgi:tetratricopeptide (TPR) repeat protein